MELFGYKIYKKTQLDTTFFHRDKLFDFLLLGRQKAIIFDIGANIGQSVELFKSRLPDSIIHSFEPNSASYTKLLAVSKKFSSVSPVKAGVGSEKGKLVLNMYKESTTNSFLKIDDSSNAVKVASHPKMTQDVETKILTEECEVVTVDGYCAENDISHIDLLKIDVQGFENEVLKGCASMLSEGNIDVILTEVILDDIYGKSNSFYELEKHIVPYGYELYDISHIYKNLKIGKTCWVDAIYVRSDFVAYQN